MVLAFAPGNIRNHGWERETKNYDNDWDPVLRDRVSQRHSGRKINHNLAELSGSHVKDKTFSECIDT
jgi:hypothetical protein